MAWKNSGVIRHFCYIPGFCQICTREKPIVKNIQKFKCLYRKMGSNSVKNREMVMACYKKH